MLWEFEIIFFPKGNYVNIAPNCTIYSCSIDDDCYIGFKSIILEGSRLEKGCAIGPNSVVPPGRIIPGGQLWAGNPVEYVYVNLVIFKIE